MRRFCQIFSAQRRNLLIKNRKRFLSGRSGHAYKYCPFGLLLDIDGVLCRGHKTLPGVPEGLLSLIDSHGRWLVPTVFVTNAGSMLREQKAQQIGHRLGIKVSRDQLVMSHSPLKMFKEYHNCHVLACGQGPLVEIATALGFTNVTTMDDLRSAYPHLDCVDQRRRRVNRSSTIVHGSIPPIEAVILFGEPNKWESSLQLLIDVLITNGQPDATNIDRGSPAHPHIPVLGCNMDLLFMSAESSLPRLTHGSFLLCLETLYKALSGRDLIYTALMGKPSTITYLHAAYVIKQIAAKMGMQAPRALYAIGDNPESDILGANLYELFLRSQRQISLNDNKIDDQAIGQSAQWGWGQVMRETFDFTSIGLEQHYEDAEGHVTQCHSVLVETGIYSKKCAMNKMGIPAQMLPHSAVLKPEYEFLKQPNFVQRDFLNALHMIYEREEWRPKLSKTPALSMA